jgi:Contractile injection system tube protein
MEDPRVKRGRITNKRTANYVEFLYNPTSISDKKGNNWVEDASPNQAHPLIHFASGKVRNITFTLNLCGESRIRRSGATLTNGAFADDDPTSMSIAGEIEYYQSLEYPVDPKLPGSTGGPDLVLFSFGRRYNALECAMEVGVDESEYDPNLNPTRAALQISLKVVKAAQEYAHDVWFPGLDGFRI